MRDKVPIPRVKAWDDREDFVEQQTRTIFGQDRRKDSGQATHGNARHATRIMDRKVDVIEKAAQIRDAHGIRKGRDVETRRTK